MRKTAIFIVAMLLILTGCASSNPTVDYVDPEEIISKFESKETFAFVIGDASCPACKAYLDGALKSFKKSEDVVLEYIDIKRNIDFNVLNNLVNVYLNNDFEYTPTTYFVVNGIIKHIEVGAIEYKSLSTQYKRYIE